MLLKILVGIALRRILPCCLVLLSACDTGMRARFEVLPPTPSAHADTTRLRVAAIVEVMARRHGLSAMGVGSSCTLGLFSARHSGDLTLTLCVTASSDTIRLRLTEPSAKRWSAKADSLRRELQDTLRLRFGSAVKP